MTRKMSALEARRQLSFLKSFDRKFQVLDRELQRLNRARDVRTTSPAGWPIDGLERTVKSLIGAGAVYGLAEISTWAREFLDALGKIRARKSAPPQEEMDWLADQIRILEKMQHDAVERAEETISGKRDSNPAPNGVSPEEEDTWESALTESENAPVTEPTAKREAGATDAARPVIQKKSPQPALRSESKVAGEPDKRESADKATTTTAVAGVKKPLADKNESVDEVRKSVSESEAKQPVAEVRKSTKSSPSGLPPKPKSTLAFANSAALFPDNAPHVIDSPGKGAPPLPGADSGVSKSADAAAESPPDNDDSDDFVGSSDTMPVDIIDIMEVSEKSGASGDASEAEPSIGTPPAPPPTSVRAARKHRALWPLAAGALLLALGVSLYFNFVGKTGESDETSVVEAPESSAPSAKKQTENADLARDSGDAPLVAADMRDTASDTDVGDTGDSSSVNATTKTEKRRARAVSKRGARRWGRKHKKSTSASGSASGGTAETNDSKSKPESTSQSNSVSRDASDDGPTGRLRISLPANAAGEIRIFVDGKKKGKAPRILSLPAGLHEVRFEMDGKKKLKMVSIKAGVTSDVTPRF